MAICRFFQQGCCKFANNCRNEHIYNNKQSHNVPQQTNTTPHLTTDQLLNLVVPEVHVALKSGQWMLSCYSPFRNNSNFPGFVDFSPEEIRFNTYQAQASGNLHQYVKRVKDVEEIHKKNYKSFLNPSNTLVKFLQTLYEGQSVQSSLNLTLENYLSNIQTSNGGNNSFDNRMHTASTQNSIDTQNPFATQTNPTSQPFFQTQQSPTATPSGASALFAFANANLQSPNNQQTPAPNIAQPTPNFAQPTPNFAQPTPNFAQPTPNFAQPTPQNLFASAAAEVTPSNHGNSNVLASPPPYQNPFEMPKTQDNPFLSNNFFNATPLNEPKGLEGVVYSNVQLLSAADVKAFESDNFIQGAIPELAPPMHLCKS